MICILTLDISIVLISEALLSKDITINNIYSKISNQQISKKIYVQGAAKTTVFHVFRGQ